MTKCERRDDVKIFRQKSPSNRSDENGRTGPPLTCGRNTVLAHTSVCVHASRLALLSDARAVSRSKEDLSLRLLFMVLESGRAGKFVVLSGSQTPYSNEALMLAPQRRSSTSSGNAYKVNA